jgi:acyl-CoA thioester hydrolase
VTGERRPQPRMEDFRFHHDFEVRFRDLDPMGHVNNAVYATYFEVARTGYMKELGVTPFEGDGIDLFPFIMLDVHCWFVAPALFTDVLRTYVRTSSIGTKSFAFEYLVTRRKDGAVVAVGSSTQVYYDYQQQRTIPVPHDFRERLERIEGRALSR